MIHAVPDVVSAVREREPDAEDDRSGRADPGTDRPDLHDRLHPDGSIRRVGPAYRDDQDPEDDHARDVRERAQDVEREDPVVERSRVADPMTMGSVDATARHLRLLTETIAAVNSSLDLQEVLELVASKVADALGTDACFVYLYDERTDELVLRATHGTRVEELTRTPRMRPGEGITGVAAAERAPVMIAEQAHLDPRFKEFPNLPEDEYESILAVPIVTRETSWRARSTSVRASHARSPRPRSSSSSRSRPRSRRRSSTRSSTSAPSGASPSWRRSPGSRRPSRSPCTSRSRSRRS